MTGSVPNAGIIRFPPAGEPTRRLFCLPFAGGGPATYRLWPRAGLDNVEICAVQYPGREPRSPIPPLDSVPDLVTSVVQAIDEAPDLPFAVFGHSLGALVAFEVTAALEASGRAQPDRLFVSARGPADEAHDAPPCHDLPEPQFLDQIQGKYGGVPDVVLNEPDLLAMLLPMLRADVRAYETYQPTADRRVDCPVHVFGGVDDRHPRPDQLAGWSRVTSGEPTVRLFEGDHFYINDQREALAREITRLWPAAARPSDR